jgi:HEAT repeat protein
MPLFGPPNIAQLEEKRDVQGLIKALGHKDASIRMAAAQALTPLRDSLAVEPLVAVLRDGDARVRQAAVAALAARGGSLVVDPLIGALEDRDPEVRATAATAVYKRLMTDPDQDTRRAVCIGVGRIHAADAVEPMVKAIMDPDEGVRVAAIKALQALGDAQAVVPLVTVLAYEQARMKATGRSNLAVERAASQALDALGDVRAIEPLKAALSHEAADVREIAVRRLARVSSPEVADTLAGVLGDDDQAIRRSAARGLQELGWRPPWNETGARYWAALREWRRCAECGAAAIPLLEASFDRADALERSDIVAALAQLGWEPPEANAMAAYFWAGQRRWDKCVEIGEPAIEALDGVLLSSAKWRDRVAAAGALQTLGQDRTAPFARVDLVQRALELLDGEGDEQAKREALEAFLAEERQYSKRAGEEVAWCACGYPADRIRKDGEREPMTDLLAFETSPSRTTTYYCPSCETRRAAPTA